MGAGVRDAVIAIIMVGTALNIMGKGYLGQSAQKAAKFITEGYGV